MLSLSDRTVEIVTSRVLIVDDNAGVRAGIRAVLSSAPELDVVGEASSGVDAVAVARRLRPDVVVLDVSMPGALDGLAAAPLLRDLPCRPEVVVFAAQNVRPLDRGWTVVDKSASADVVRAEVVDAARRRAAVVDPVVARADGQCELVARAAGGDAGAWEQLYRAAYPKLHAYAVRRVGPADVDDAVAATFERALGGLDGFAGTGSGFDGWLFGIARRTIADHHRSAARARRPTPASAPVATAGPLDALVDTEDAAAARRAFERLPGPDRDILELRVIAGLSTEDAAAALGRHPASLRMAQSRALAKLRRALAEELA